MGKWSIKVLLVFLIVLLLFLPACSTEKELTDSSTEPSEEESVQVEQPSEQDMQDYQDALEAAGAGYLAREYEKAAEQYEKALSFDNQQPEVYRRLAQCFLNTGNLAKAGSTLKEGYLATGSADLQNAVLYGNPTLETYGTHLALLFAYSANAVDYNLVHVYYPTSFGLFPLCYEFHDGFAVVSQPLRLNMAPFLLYYDEEGRILGSESLRPMSFNQLADADAMLFLEALNNHRLTNSNYVEEARWDYQYDEEGRLVQIVFNGVPITIQYGSGWARFEFQSVNDEREWSSTVYLEEDGSFKRVETRNGSSGERHDYLYSSDGSCRLSYRDEYGSGYEMVVDADNRMQSLSMNSDSGSDYEAKAEYLSSNRLTRLFVDGEQSSVDGDVKCDYDLKGRLDAYTVDGKSGRCFFDEAGRLTQLRGENGNYTFTYDETGKPIEVIREQETENESLRLLYNEDSQIEAILGTWDGTSVNKSFARDTLGRVCWTIAGNLEPMSAARVLFEEVTALTSTTVKQGTENLSFVKPQQEWPSYVKDVQVNDEEFDVSQPGKQTVVYSIQVEASDYYTANMAERYPSYYDVSGNLPDVAGTVHIYIPASVTVIANPEDEVGAIVQNRKLDSSEEKYGSVATQHFSEYMNAEVYGPGVYNEDNQCYEVEVADEIVTEKYSYYFFTLADADRDGEDELILLSDYHWDAGGTASINNGQITIVDYEPSADFVPSDIQEYWEDDLYVTVCQTVSFGAYASSYSDRKGATLPFSISDSGLMELYCNDYWCYVNPYSDQVVETAAYYLVPDNSGAIMRGERDWVLVLRGDEDYPVWHYGSNWERNEGWYSLNSTEVVERIRNDLRVGEFYDVQLYTVQGEKN